MIKLVVAALIAALLVAGGYFAYTTYINPTPAVQPASSGSPAGASTEAAGQIVTSQVNADGIPLQVSSLPLSGSEKGKSALDEFAKMHGEGFDLVDGYRADYSDGSAKATLYVGQARDASSATKLADGMAQKIGPNNAMFTELTSLNISNRTIYEVKGQGQLHFFYAVNDKLVWLAVDSGFAADGLHTIWSAIK